MSKQNSINSQDVLKSFKSNKKERFWKEKISAASILLVVVLILYFIFSGNKTKDFASRFQGNIATKTNLILYLSAKNGELSGYYYDFCDSIKKINIKGTLDKNGKFVLDELEENNPNSPSLKGALGEDGSLSGERTENFSNKKSSFYFARITAIPSITCEEVIMTKKRKRPEEPKKDKTNIPKTPQPIALEVKGKDLKDLRSKLDKKTKSIMRGINYLPQNPILDIANYKFTCDLIPHPSANFSKIGLFFGPKSNGFCESCSNVLNRNPGSEELIKDEDNVYFYSIIALPR